MTPEQCRAARGLLNWSQTDLAQRSGVDRTTINRLETGRRQSHASRREDESRLNRTVDLLRGAFQRGGVEFIERGVKLAS